MLARFQPRPAHVGFLIVSFLLATMPRVVEAKSPVKIKAFSGAIDLSAPGAKPFEMTGTASHLGTYECRGEVEFEPVGRGGAADGHGVAVFETANGDQLVAQVTWEIDAGAGDLRTSAIHFSWRDFVQFGDGTIVLSTGRFVDDRPAGLVVIAIIAILIGLLLPAVQKVR